MIQKGPELETLDTNTHMFFHPKFFGEKYKIKCSCSSVKFCQNFLVQKKLLMELLSKLCCSSGTQKGTFGEQMLLMWMEKSAMLLRELENTGGVRSDQPILHNQSIFIAFLANVFFFFFFSTNH